MSKRATIGEAGSWVVEGIGEDFVPPIADLSPVRTAYRISDAESLSTRCALLKQEGILAGSSSGTLVAAALRYCRAQTRPSGWSRWSATPAATLSKMFNDFWMNDRGFLAATAYGNFRDVISRQFAAGAVVSVEPDDLLKSSTLGSLHDVSQLPVLAEGKIVGIDRRVGPAHGRLADAARSAAGTRVHDRQARDHSSAGRRSRASARLRAGHVAVVADDDSFYGLITRVDIVSYLRRQRQAA